MIVRLVRKATSEKDDRLSCAFLFGTIRNSEGNIAAFVFCAIDSGLRI